MRALLICAAVLAAVPAQAAIYKCPGPGGQVIFSDKPCGGAAESPEQQIEVSPQPTQQRPSKTQAELDAEWEEQKRFRYVEVPNLEREAAALMASGDAQKAALGREMAWQAHQAKEAFGQLERARAARAETNARYKRALDQLNGY